MINDLGTTVRWPHPGLGWALLGQLGLIHGLARTG